MGTGLVPGETAALSLSPGSLNDFKYLGIHLHPHLNTW